MFEPGGIWAALFFAVVTLLDGGFGRALFFVVNPRFTCCAESATPSSLWAVQWGTCSALNMREATTCEKRDVFGRRMPAISAAYLVTKVSLSRLPRTGQLDCGVRKRKRSWRFYIMTDELSVLQSRTNTLLHRVNILSLSGKNVNFESIATAKGTRS